MEDESLQIEIALDYPVSVEAILNVSFNCENFKAIFDFILYVLRRHEAAIRKNVPTSKGDNFGEELEKMRQELGKTQELTEKLLSDTLGHSEKLEVLKEFQLSTEEKHISLSEAQESLKASFEVFDSSLATLTSAQTSILERLSTVEISNETLAVASNSHERALESNNNSLKEIYARLDKSEEDISKQLRSLEAFRKDLDEEIARNDKSERAIADAKEKLEKHTGVMNDHEKRLHQLETDIDQAMKAIKSLGGEVQQISKPIEPVIQEVVEVQDNSKLDSLYANIRDLSKQLKDIELRLANSEDATGKVKELAERTDQTTKVLEEELKKLEEMMRKGSGSSSGGKEISSSELEALKKWLKDLENASKTSSEDIDLLKKHLKTLEESLKKKANFDELESIRHAGSTGQPIVSDMKAIRELQHRVDDLQKLLQELASRSTDGNKSTDTKSLRDLNSRIEELERNLAGLNVKSDDLGSRVSLVEVSINKKVNKPEFDELKKLIGSMEGKPSVRSDESLDNSKLISLSKRVVVVEDHLKLLRLPDGHDIVAIFNLLIKVQNDSKDTKDKYEKVFKDIWNRFKDLEDALMKKANIEDLKALEDFLKGKLLELASEFAKKYAEKIETKRALVYLEKLIKDHDTFKAIPEGDDAMLARKPLGGWSCASCQKELEKLAGKVAPYQHWNKMPYRDPADRIARAGPGFSRMLATIQPDSITNRTRASAFRNNSPPSHIDEEITESVSLPPVKKNSERPLTTL